MTETAAEPPPLSSQAGRRPEAIKAIPVRHPWRWVAALVVLVVVADIVYTLATAPDLRWDVVLQWLSARFILEGIVVTLELTVLAMVIGIALGITLAVMRLSPNPVTSWVSWFYIWFFRGTPVLVQIFFWFNLNSVLKHIGIGIPPNGPWLWEQSTNALISPFMAATLGLGLNEAAYMAEIVRAGIISVEHGQTEAAQALGMNRLLVMRRIILPQAMRVIIPPTGNETISMLKTTSLAVIASVPELFTRSQQVSNFNFSVIELAIVASIWYLVMTTVLTIGQYYIERYYAKGSLRDLPLTPFQRFRRMLFTFHAPPPAPAPVIGVKSEHR
ncbi:MAG TPA: amino acid ABC transporter permease [Candidatus Dormibacteraeota bacterium]|nr:amino acid ABC transporter permease [Candidatus Dormibacteraeota bacterium]